MKFTMDNLINFMREKENIIITDEQVEEIKKYLYNDTEDLIYWCYTSDDFYFEGIISKNLYEFIQTLDQEKEYSFGEVSYNYCLDFSLDEIDFYEDVEIINNYINSEKHNGMDLMNFIKKDVPDIIS